MFKNAIDPGKLEAFLEINELLNSNFSDLNGLFTQILESATRLTDGEASSLLLVHPETQALEFVVALGPKGPEVKSFTVPKGEGIAGWVADNNTPIHVPDVARDSRFYSKISENVGFATQAILAAPLRVQGRCVGVLEMINKRGGREFTAEDLTWLELFANQAGIAIRNARSFQAIRNELQTLRTALENRVSAPTILTAHPKMLELLDLCRRYAITDSPVLVTGENGTGKELIADYLHFHSPRSTGPVVKVNCAALPEGLLESELFGHVKGAYTDAVSDRAGRFEQAHGGTLFLDEIGCLAPQLQSKILRALQSRTFQRVGGSRTLELDARIVAATNEDLEAAVAQGRFRQDLYYRLNVLPVRLPALRERVGDVALLADFFLTTTAKASDRPRRALTPAALATLEAHSWPGNVRELQNTIERALLLAQGDEIVPSDLGLAEVAPPSEDLKGAVLAFKAALVRRTLAETGGNQTKAARRLGIQRTYLSKLMKELEIDNIEKGVHDVPNP